MAMDPGVMPGTGIMRHAPLFYRFIFQIAKYFLRVINYFFPNLPIRSPQRSADDLLFATFDEDMLGVHPKAVTLNGRVEKITSAESRDEAKAKRLWKESLVLSGLKQGDTILVNWK